MPARFSASDLRRRGRRNRNPVAQPHDRKPAAPASPAPPVAPEQASTQDDTAPPVRPPTVNAPLPTRAVRMPKTAAPFEPAKAAPAASMTETHMPATSPSEPPSTNGSTPPLPQREKGASARAKEEALDLFGELEADAGGGRSSLADFQRGQDSARQEGRS